MAFSRLMLMGTAGLLGACTLQQPPANVVSGYGYNKQKPQVYAETKVAPVAENTVLTPPVLLDPPGNAMARAGMAEESLAAVEPAGGPVQTMNKVAQIPAKSQMPETRVTHTVLPSDTAYKLARKYNTTVERILKDNGLKSIAEVKEGLTLTIAQNSKPQVSAWDDMKRVLENAASDKPIQQAKNPVETKVLVTAELPKAIADIEPAAGETTEFNRKTMPVAPVVVAQPEFVKHTVQPKETIYRISQQYHVSVLDIMAANDFNEPQDLKADTVIKVPVQTKEAKIVETRSLAETEPAAGEPVQVAMLNNKEIQSDATPVAEVKAVQEPVVSSIKESKLDAKVAEKQRGQIDPVAARAKGLVWPVRGEILKRFGDDGHGVARTGINISVPQGTPVLASEGGTVLYADDGLKIYGKMVLIRHDNGMVSAYAHNGYLLVKKNERVKKGQVVALSGATGNVESPQVHFELRQHASAVDPIAMLPRL